MVGKGAVAVSPEDHQSLVMCLEPDDFVRESGAGMFAAMSMREAVACMKVWLQNTESTRAVVAMVAPAKGQTYRDYVLLITRQLESKGSA